MIKQQFKENFIPTIVLFGIIITVSSILHIVMNN